jgi:accessory gene regulator protein AgrB
MAKYWFRQKTFGYGATPSTWQGWTLTVVSIVLLALIAFVATFIRDNNLRALWIVGASALVLIPSVWISHAKTEGGWRWRR